jgi:hypothetical protein
MEEDLGKEGIELKPKKPRSDAQVKAFEKAREIRLENSKLKKEKIAQVKEEVKNRNKVAEQIVPPTTPSLPLAVTKKQKPIVKEESDDEPDIVVVKRKKKPKVIYMEESDDEPEPQIIKKKKEPVIEATAPLVQPVLAKPPQSIRFF